MFKKDIFKDKDEGIKNLTDVINSVVEIQGGTFEFEIPDEEKSKKVWHLSNDSSFPCIVEFDMDVEAEKPLSENYDNKFK